MISPLDEKVQRRIAQKSNNFKKNIAVFLKSISAEIPQLFQVSFVDSKISKDGSLLTLYFFSSFGRELGEEVIRILIPYIPALKHYMATHMRLRFLPRILLAYDTTQEKIAKITSLIERANTLQQ